MKKNKKYRNSRGKTQAFLKIFQINNTLYISLIFSFIGIVSLILNLIEKKDVNLSLSIAATALLSGFGSLIINYIGYRKEEKNLYSVDHLEYKNKTLKKIETQYATPQHGYRFLTTPNSREPYLHSDNVDQYLRNPATVIKLTKLKEKYTLPVELAPFVPFALKEKLNSGRIFYNGKKIRLMSELTETTKEVKVQKTDYFSTFCTNDLVYLKIRSHRSLNKRFYGHHLLFNDQDELSRLDEGVLSNNIGVSTLAKTSDNYLIIGHQGSLNNVGANRYVPTASGSGDYHDIKGRKTLHELLVFAMEREFREEYNLPSSAIIKTKVVGYIRLLKRGGKPDFFGFSSINMTKAEIISCFKKGKEFKSGYMKEPVFIKCDDVTIINNEIRQLNDLTIQLQYYLNHYFI